MLNDRINFQFLDYSLNKITVPTLVIHAKDDGLILFTHGQYSAKNIPTVQFVPLKSGGHLLMGQHEKARSEIIEFLNQHIQITSKKAS